VANTSISKQGYGEMAITGCYAGCLFDFMLGIGISSIKENFQT